MKPEFSAFIAFPAQSYTLVSHHRPHRKIRRFGDGWQSGFAKSALPVGGGIGANSVAERLTVTLRLRMWVLLTSRKRRQGILRCRIPPRRAHDTLQPQDESIIVGYYTSAEVFPQNAIPYHQPKLQEEMPMARGDGIHRTNARNIRLTAAKIGNAQQHNEREKESYVNQDIVPERTHLNVHFKKPAAG